MMTRRLLVVCTANVCRSPVAEQLLAQRLARLQDSDGERWTVRSAGTSNVRAAPDPNTAAAAAAAGIDVTAHTARHLDASILRHDGADLTLVMTRAHLRDVISIDLAWWPRTFTLKELVRRAGQHSPAAPGEPFGSWLARVAAGRRAAGMITPDGSDDLRDPYGRPRQAHDEMVGEVDALVDNLLRLGPWEPAPPEPERPALRDPERPPLRDRHGPGYSSHSRTPEVRPLR
jgi:protein-tyrosine phosphatase